MASWTPPSPPPSPPPIPQPPLDEEAAEYVRKHSLEHHLSSAVDAAIKAKAPDALDFISRFLYPSRSSGGGGSKGRGPLALELHVKARGQENGDYPSRLHVSDVKCRWSVPWPDYTPVDWTHPVVLKNSRELPTGGKWADPDDVASMRSELEGRVTYSMGGEERHLRDCIQFDANGRPINPVGRTGIAGRGLLGKWGPNHAADPIVTRYHPTTGALQVVAIQRKDTGQWAIPGGMVDAGEAVSVTVKREFKEEAGEIEDPVQRAEFERMTDTLFASGTQVYRGYVDDPRITDNAWIETTAFHFHCPKEVGDKMPLAAGDDAGKVMWLDISTANETYQQLYGAHRALIDEAVWSAWSRGALRCGIVAPPGQRN